VPKIGDQVIAMPKSLTLAISASVEATAESLRMRHRGKAPPRARSSGSRTASNEADAKLKSLPLPVFLLLISIQLPWLISIGPLRFTPYRLVLIALLPLLLLRWSKGAAGAIQVTDIALLLLCGWCAFAMCVIHGVGPSVEPAGVYFIETMGGFLVARCYIRDQESFYLMSRMLFIITAVLLPFALHESVTGRRFVAEVFEMVFPTYPGVEMQRWGLTRAQVNYIHPIHFGVSIGCTLTLIWLVVGYGRPLFSRLAKAGVVFSTSFLALSSGPLTSVIAQIGLMCWGRVMQRIPMKWTLMGVGGIIFVALVELFANRSLAVILIGMFAFDEFSAYIRTLTWEYGTRSIMNHPLFGVGFNMWDKPDWLTASIDMHWILDAVRHGIPAGILTFTAFFSAVIAIGRARISDPKHIAYRAAYMFTMAGFFMTGWAVYFWESTFVLFMFLLASGFWILDHQDPPAARKSARRQKIRHPSGVSANS